MATLDELIHYCKSKNPIGAFMLDGEWGSGKTHLVEKDLSDALIETHLIARISLYGMNDTEILRKAVKEKWLSTCAPVLGKLVEQKEQVNKSGGLISAITTILSGLNPGAGRAANVMMNFDLTDFMKIEPEIEDVHDHSRKRVILVFDDLERSKLNPLEVMGLINEFCENMHFHCVIITNESFLTHTLNDYPMYHMLKVKTVSTTAYYVPDFRAIITSIIRTRTWPTDAYKRFLKNHIDEILNLFVSDYSVTEVSDRSLVKAHNLLTLTSGMEEFYRIYYHLANADVQDMDPWLYAFLAYHLIRKCGFIKDGTLCNECSDEELQELYPQFQPEYLHKSMRNWISYGIWDRESFNQELTEFLNK